MEKVREPEKRLDCGRLTTGLEVEESVAVCDYWRKLVCLSTDQFPGFLTQCSATSVE